MDSLASEGHALEFYFENSQSGNIEEVFSIAMGTIKPATTGHVKSSRVVGAARAPHNATFDRHTAGTPPSEACIATVAKVVR